MISFGARIEAAAARGGRLILACDYDASEPDPEGRALADVSSTGSHLCAVKINFHLLLRLGPAQVGRIAEAARRRGVQCIADVKLNDIGSTNAAAARALWGMGFDAVIANPIMGREALARLAAESRAAGKGVIALCHMSSPEARHAYELLVRQRSLHAPLYALFLEWAASAGADGVVLGATFPEVIRRHRKSAPGGPAVYSPGVGAQGGSAAEAVRAGADYVIAGRSVTGAADPAAEAASLARQCAESAAARG